MCFATVLLLRGLLHDYIDERADREDSAIASMWQLEAISNSKSNQTPSGCHSKHREEGKTKTTNTKNTATTQQQHSNNTATTKSQMSYAGSQHSSSVGLSLLAER